MMYPAEAAVSEAETAAAAAVPEAAAAAAGDAAHAAVAAAVAHAATAAAAAGSLACCEVPSAWNPSLALKHQKVANITFTFSYHFHHLSIIQYSKARIQRHVQRPICRLGYAPDCPLRKKK